MMRWFGRGWSMPVGVNLLESGYPRHFKERRFSGCNITLLVFEDLKAQGTDFGLALLQSRSFARDGIKAGDQFPIGKGAGSVSGNGIHNYSGFRLVELFAKLVKKGLKGLGKAETCHTYSIGIVVKT
jgi:hypothetical protein